MPYVTVGQENSTPIELYYEDHGSGHPVVLIHGWPLSGASWEKQTLALLAAGYRVITYDRRGFGQSDKPAEGYNYDTFAQDLHHLLNKLNLEDVMLVGFSMGSGEVARYLGKYGSARINRAVFISVVPPFLLKTDDNPTGVDSSIFRDIEKNLGQDRPAFLWQFLNNFFNYDTLQGQRISEQAVHANWAVANQASAYAVLECVRTWTTDFREDLKKIDVPSLIIHGNADRILPIHASGIPLSKSLPNSRFVVVDEGPHGLLWTHFEEVNHELLIFLEEARLQRARPQSQAPRATPASLH
jgi:non-heme chloroperoxidase